MSEQITTTAAQHSVALLQKRVRVLEILIRGIAHDLNNGLAPVSVFVSLLRSGLPASEFEKKLSLLEQAAEDSRGLMEQLLNLGESDLAAPMVIQCRHLVRAVVSDWRRTPDSPVPGWSITPRSLWPVRIPPIPFYELLVELCRKLDSPETGGQALIVETANVNPPGEQCSESPSADAPAVQIRGTLFSAPLHLEDLTDAVEIAFSQITDDPRQDPGRDRLRGLVANWCGSLTFQRRGDTAAFRMLLPAVQPSELPDRGRPKSRRSGRHNRDSLLIVGSPKLEPGEISCAGLGLEASTVSQALRLLAERKEQIKVVLIDTDRNDILNRCPRFVAQLRAICPGASVLIAANPDRFPDRSVAFAHLTTLRPERILLKPFTPENLQRIVQEVLRSGPPKPAVHPPLVQSQPSWPG